MFGLGSSAFPSFCSFARELDKILGELQAEQLLDMGEGDDLNSQEENFHRWASQVFKVDRNSGSENCVSPLSLIHKLFMCFFLQTACDRFGIVTSRPNAEAVVTLRKNPKSQSSVLSPKREIKDRKEGWWECHLNPARATVLRVRVLDCNVFR